MKLRKEKGKVERFFDAFDIPRPMMYRVAYGRAYAMTSDEIREALREWFNNRKRRLKRSIELRAPGIVIQDARDSLKRVKEGKDWVSKLFAKVLEERSENIN